MYGIHILYSRLAERMARLRDWKCVFMVGKLTREHLLVERNVNIKRDYLGRFHEDVDEVLNV